MKPVLQHATLSGNSRQTVVPLLSVAVTVY